MTSRSRNWCATLNATDDDFLPERPFDEKVFDEKMTYLIYQLERGGNAARRHWQCFFVLKNPASLHQMKKWFGDRFHFEVARDVLASIAYCTPANGKEGVLTPGVEFGTRPSQGKRNDLESVKTLIDEGASMLDVANSNFGAFVRYNRGFALYKSLVDQTPRDFKTEVIVFWGPPGSGKTYHCNELAEGKAFWCMKQNNPTVWWDGYDGQQDVIIEDFKGWMPHTMFLGITDQYKAGVRTSNMGEINFRSKRIFITSNYHPQDWYQDAVPGALERRLTHVFYFPNTKERPCVTCKSFPPQAACPCAVNFSFNDGCYSDPSDRQDPPAVADSDDAPSSSSSVFNRLIKSTDELVAAIKKRKL